MNDIIDANSPDNYANKVIQIILALLYTIMAVCAGLFIIFIIERLTNKSIKELLETIKTDDKSSSDSKASAAESVLKLAPAAAVAAPFVIGITLAVKTDPVNLKFNPEPVTVQLRAEPVNVTMSAPQGLNVETSIYSHDSAASSSQAAAAVPMKIAASFTDSNKPLTLQLAPSLVAPASAIDLPIKPIIESPSASISKLTIEIAEIKDFSASMPPSGQATYSDLQPIKDSIDKISSAIDRSSFISTAIYLGLIDDIKFARKRAEMSVISEGVAQDIGAQR